jgi:SagB-type dehydrogenase family enzyme
VSDSLFLSLRQDSQIPLLSADDNGEMTLRAGGWSSSIRGLTPAVLHGLLALATTGEYQHLLTARILQAEGVEALATFYYYLRYLGGLQLLRVSVLSNNEPLATLVPISMYFEYASRTVQAGVRYGLSRFAYARVEAGEMIVESPLSHARLVLHDQRASALALALAAPTSNAALKQVPNLATSAADQLMTLMLNAGMLTAFKESGNSAEQDDPSLRTWEFHDLLFHSRSREGRHDGAIGGTYRFAGDIDPPAAFKSVSADHVVPLNRPDLERRKREDAPFALVQDQRRSIREYDDRPITVEQLSEFLYRVGRVTACEEAEIQTPAGPLPMDFAHRPYPGGGALYELEIYLAVEACEKLEAGLYHYLPQRHELRRVAGLTSDVSELLSGAARGAGIDRDGLQVLVILAARFQRVMWKYASIAYATILKNAGVLYQTMYLVATAMELAPCGLGCGNADLFARAAGTSYYEETSVGEFLLASARSGRGVVQP